MDAGDQEVAGSDGGGVREGVRRQESGDRSQETGVRRQESGDRSQETGDRRQEKGEVRGEIMPADCVWWSTMPQQ
jgi:hypothetical protein